MKLKTHNFWNMDETKHWHKCSGNNAKLDEEEHTLDQDNICTVCGYNSNLVYTLLVDGESYSVKASKEAKGNIVIPASYNDKPITRIEDSAFSNLSNITSVVIPEGVTSIENHAFEGCSNLVSIVIPNSVKSIGDKAFSRCVRLVEVVNKSRLEIIKGSEDNGQVALLALNVKTQGESEIVNLNNYLFYTANGTNYLVGYLGKDTLLDLPDNYNGEDYIINSFAFYNCTQVTRVKIMDGVIGIKTHAFLGCSSLDGMINASFMDITLSGQKDDFIAYGKSWNQSQDSPEIININDFLFYFENGVNHLAGYIGEEIKLVLPDSFNGKSYVIDSYAFYDNKNIFSIVIPDSVISIGANAFYGCYHLVEVINKSSLNIWLDDDDNGGVDFYAVDVKTKGESEIVNVDGFLFYTKDINGDPLNYLVGYLGEETRLVLPDCYISYSIVPYAFYNCLNITKVVIPECVVSIGNNAFAGCENLNKIVNKSLLLIYPHNDDNGMVGYYASEVLSKGDCEIVNANDYLFYTLDGINYLFGYEGKDTRLVLPDSFNGEPYEIDTCAFMYHDLLSIVIPKCVTRIGFDAFLGCKIIEVINKSKLDIVKGSKTHGSVAFYALDVKTRGESEIVNVNNFLFYTAGGTNYLIGYAGKEISLVLPNNYKGEPYEIYSFAFQNCSNLTSVVIPNGVTKIGDYAFANCSRLLTVEIGDAVTDIGGSVFEGCANLSQVINKSKVDFNKGSEDYEKLVCYLLNVLKGYKDENS